MASHSVNVLIKARDEASKKFGIIAASAGVMGKALKGSASMISTAFRASFEVIKKGAMGIAAAFTYATYAAIKQEAAEVELASALKITGQYTKENMKYLKAYAAEIQNVTAYGDEQVIMLMRHAMTLGWSAEEAGKAAKAAIALFEGFGGGRGKPMIFLRYYTDAMRGTGSSLASYVGELRKAKTQEEAHVILQKALTRGWDVAKSKIESAGGAWRQTKNVLGDVAEKIAWPLLPAIKNSGQAITKWAQDNQAQIGLWAEKTYSYVVLIKDVFMSFVDFMRKDWLTGMNVVFDSFVELLKASFYSAVQIAVAGSKSIIQAFRLQIPDYTRYTKKERRRAIELYAASEEFNPSKQKQLAPGIYELKEIPKEFYQKAREEFKKEKIMKPFLEAVVEIGKEFKISFSKIVKNLPPEIQKSIEEAEQEHKARLAKLKLKPIGPGVDTEGWPGSLGGGLGGAAGKLVRTIRQSLAPRETRLLTFAPGTSFNYERQIAVNSANQLRETKEIQRDQKKATNYLELLYREFVKYPNPMLKSADFN